MTGRAPVGDSTTALGAPVPVLLPTEQTEPAEPVTHYLDETMQRGLCGARRIIFDLTPFNGRITCEVCQDLWAQGYSLVNPPARPDGAAS